MNVLITGGLGFIGVNTAYRFLNRGDNVLLFDNLSKFGSFNHLKNLEGANYIYGDLRNKNDVDGAIKDRDIDIVIHLGGQTAVTTSVDNPELDFESNAVGTFNVLEAIRKYAPGAKVIYSSTNKVYGEIPEEDVGDGINEDYPLDFRSPYGCSKGAADQYVRDYARIYGLKTVVARQSCIYGEYQDGTENQGWVAWFALAFLKDYPITIFGDGKQVRDVLYVQDLVMFYEMVLREGRFKGDVYNIGGGKKNAISLLELIEHLKKVTGKDKKISFAEKRPGDQQIYISDNSKAEKYIGWKPITDYKHGIGEMIQYLGLK